MLNKRGKPSIVNINNDSIIRVVLYYHRFHPEVNKLRKEIHGVYRTNRDMETIKKELDNQIASNNQIISRKMERTSTEFLLPGDLRNRRINRLNMNFRNHDINVTNYIPMQYLPGLFISEEAKKLIVAHEWQRISEYLDSFDKENDPQIEDCGKRLLIKLFFYLKRYENILFQFESRAFRRNIFRITYHITCKCIYR